MLSGRPALIMKYLRPLELKDGELTEKNRKAVVSAIEAFASKGLRHDDLAFRHLGVLLPPPKKKNNKKGAKDKKQKQDDKKQEHDTVVLFDSL